MSTRRAMIRTYPKLSIRRQCELLQVNRAHLYYEPVTPDPDDLALMRHMDELHLKHPFFGSRMLTQMLKREGRSVNRKRIQRLMRLMGLESLAPKPHTSSAAPEHPKYPYLLRQLKVVRVNQVWASDITYIPMKRGFAYLVAVIDWYSRCVLSWKISPTLEADFCVKALEEALEAYPHPDIFNTDQGAQFTADAFIDVLRDHHIKISMDGKGRCIDNIFVERLWRSLKYEEVYLNEYDDLSEAEQGISQYISFFNEERPHSTLGYQTPRAFFQMQMTA